MSQPTYYDIVRDALAADRTRASHDRGRHCDCVAEHRPLVMEFIKHHIRPEYLGGDNSDENTIWICSNTHVNTHEIIRALVSNKPYGAYSTYARKLAIEGVRRWREDEYGAA